MASYAANAQNMAAGDAVMWTRTIEHGNCNVQHVDGSDVIALRGSGCCCRPNVYSVNAHVVITAPDATPVQFQITVDGAAVPGSIIAFPAVAAGTILSEDLSFSIPADCCCNRLRLVSVTPANLASAYIRVKE